MPTIAELDRRNQRNGIIMIAAPFVGLVLLLIIWSIISALIPEESSATAVTLMQIVNVVLGLLGVIAVVAMMILIPLGIATLVRVEIPDDEADPRSGKGRGSAVPEGIQRWNWGAFMLSFYWGLYYRVWFVFIQMIPIVNIVMSFYFGYKGNVLAWQKNRWRSVEAFQRSQRAWSIVGLVLFGLNVGMVAFMLVAMFFSDPSPEESRWYEDGETLQSTPENTEFIREINLQPVE